MIEPSADRDVARAIAPPAYRRWLASTIGLLIAAWFAWIVATNQNFEWPVVAQYLTANAMLRGLSVTVGLTVIAMAIGVVLGLLLAVARLSQSRPLYLVASVYIWFFRGTPLLVQLLFWYNLSALFPTIGTWNTNDLISPTTTAIAGLGLNEAAYMAEIIRGGLLSVPRGQYETAQAFGMTYARALARIILPQAMRAIIPPKGNQLISMIKATSLVSVIAMTDLLYSVQAVYNRTFQVIPLLMVAVLWYLFITSILNVGQSAIERFYARSEQDAVVGQRKEPLPEPA
jgi:polar amino acid transport system permease protein